jgi:DNA repair exonuclease SbcCD ATPase subunit
MEKTTIERDSVSYGGDDNLAKHQEELKHILANKELSSLVKAYNENVVKLEELMAREEAEMREKVEQIRSGLWVDGTSDEIIEQIEVWSTLLNLKKEMQSVQKDLAKLPPKDDRNLEQLLRETKDRIREINNDLEREKLERASYSCPHCRKRVRFHNNELVNIDNDTGERKDVFQLQAQLKNLNLVEKSFTDGIDAQKKRKVFEDKIATLKRNIDELEDETTSIDECEESVLSLRETLRKNEEDEKLLLTLESSLKEKKFSQTIMRIQKQVENDKKKIEALSGSNRNLDSSVNEEELRNVIAKEKGERERLTRLSQTLEKMINEKEKIEAEILSIQKEKSEKTESEIQNEIGSLSSEIYLHTERKEKIEFFLKEVEKWRINEKEVLEYEKLRTSVEELREKEIEDRKKYTSACTFRDNILEAESLYVSNLIDNINNNVQLYLDHFFPDHPITIRLTSFKENGKNETKPSINMEIDYKGMEMDLSMLSGGELSRVILSFTLAFADLYNSPLILLDECTSSLDQDLTSSVLEGLKENFGEKLTLIVAHQVVKGVFDKVVEL